MAVVACRRKIRKVGAAVGVVVTVVLMVVIAGSDKNRYTRTTSRRRSSSNRTSQSYLPMRRLATLRNEDASAFADPYRRELNLPLFMDPAGMNPTSNEIDVEHHALAGLSERFPLKQRQSSGRRGP